MIYMYGRIANKLQKTMKTLVDIYPMVKPDNEVHRETKIVVEYRTINCADKRIYLDDPKFKQSKQYEDYIFKEMMQALPEYFI